MSNELVRGIVSIVLMLVAIFFMIAGMLTYLYSIAKVFQEKKRTNKAIYRFCVAMIFHFIAGTAAAITNSQFAAYSNFIFAILVAMVVIRSKFFSNFKPA